MFRVMQGCRLVAWLLAAMVAVQSIPLGVAQAGMLATNTVAAPDQVDQRSMVRSYLARDEVRGALRTQGVDPDEASARVAALSDGEVAMIAARIDDDPAGQGLGIVIAAGLIALIVLIVADATGQTDVF